MEMIVNLALGQNVKKILGWLIATTVVLTLAVTLFALRTFSSIPLDRLELLESDLLQANSRKAAINKLQSGAHVEKSMLQNFWLFSDASIPFEKWLDEQIILGALKDQGQEISVEKTVSLPRLMANECQQVYCYQKRLSFENIPSVFWKGLIGIEDVRFLDHAGVDLRSIARAIITDIKAMKLVQGGSTITQQLVKNLFLTSEKSFTRKIQEVLVAVYIEAQYPKENILEAYFNEVFWGAFEGIRLKGLYAASIFYFQKKPSQLNSYEASILIALLKGPGFYHPINHQSRLKSRVKVVYQKLKEMNLFFGSQDVLWTDEDWESWGLSFSREVQKEQKRSLWLSLYLDQEILNEFDAYVLTHEAQVMKKQLIKKYPDLDLAIKIKIAQLGRKGIDTDLKSLSFYSKHERSVADAIGTEKHQIGSTLKPVIFHVLQTLGLDLKETVSTEKFTLKLKSGEWSPRETLRDYPESVSLETALQLSMNRPIIKAVEKVGFDKVEEKLKGYVPRLLVPLSEYPAQLLGAVEISLNELIEVYAKFIIEQCMLSSPSVINLLIDPTKTTIRKQVQASLSEIKFFGKTGTSNDGLDNLFVFYDGHHLGAIWVGVESRRGESKVKLYGSTTAFELYQQYAVQRGSRFPEFSCHSSKQFEVNEKNQ